MLMSEDRPRRSDLCSRTVSESNVFLDPFSYSVNSHASDTISVDSSDSMETSFSAGSPDNISRYRRPRDAKCCTALKLLSTVGRRGKAGWMTSNLAKLGDKFHLEKLIKVLDRVEVATGY